MHAGLLLTLLAVLVAGCAAPAAPAEPAPTAGSPPGGAPAEGEPSPAAPPNATGGPRPGDVLAEGTIALGSPTTGVRSLTVLAGLEGIESFRIPAVPPPGSVVATHTTDRGGLGFNVDLWFHAADGAFLGGCAAPEGEERCEVPEGAASGTVDATRGRDLAVRVVLAAVPPA